MIGPELQFDMDNHNVCYHCEQHNKKLNYECHSMLYHDYVSSPKYQQPTVIVGFQAELYDVETWAESIRALRAQNCPLLLTTKFPHEISKNIIKIQAVLNNTVSPVLQTVNRFCALRPYRDLNSNEVFYRNKHLIIFRSLRS
ncbi:hypothetical protein EAI_15212 [Harpegnathos saltator]|uniref:Mitochondrial splicing suppressor 51-like C-terminal domain-containing protein n=1 Tax=Harpegnathos saltator TaxID=610380 RepID=E2BR66_HARSA|nr:hypothetical protein EAI_15212 [Harpegnathos saltator]